MFRDKKVRPASPSQSLQDKVGGEFEGGGRERVLVWKMLISNLCSHLVLLIWTYFVDENVDKASELARSDS